MHYIRKVAVSKELARLIADLNYDVKVSGRARNVTLKVNRAQGLTIVVPKDFDQHLLPEIVSARRDWIDRQLERFEALPGKFDEDWPPERLAVAGVGLEFGIVYLPKSGNRLRLVQRDDVLMIELPEKSSSANLATLLVNWLKEFARWQYPLIVEELSAQTGLGYGKIVVRGQKTRWGSYSSKGTLSLNYKLLFLPERLLRHVILHELAHSEHMNHSPEFWSLLESIDTHMAVHDKELADGWKYLPRWIE